MYSICAAAFLVWLLTNPMLQVHHVEETWATTDIGLRGTIFGRKFRPSCWIIDGCVVTFWPTVMQVKADPLLCFGAFFKHLLDTLVVHSFSVLSYLVHSSSIGFDGSDKVFEHCNIWAYPKIFIDWKKQAPVLLCIIKTFCSHLLICWVHCCTRVMNIFFTILQSL